MSCTLISLKSFAIEIPNNIDPQLKCSLCKNNLIRNCVDCDNIKNCKIIKGMCECLYHNHCIQKWININNNCPNCENLWKLKEIINI
jgi:hypothetical protein